MTAHCYQFTGKVLCIINPIIAINWITVSSPELWSKCLEKVGNLGTMFPGNFAIWKGWTMFPGNFAIWKGICVFQIRRYTRNSAKFCNLGEKFHCVSGMNIYFSSHDDQSDHQANSTAFVTVVMKSLWSSHQGVMEPLLWRIINTLVHFRM